MINIACHDLQNIIFSKLYYTQPIELLNDIKHFHLYKNQLIIKYYKKGLTDDTNYDDDFNLYTWLSNDLSSFFNDNLPYNYAISINNINKIKRLFKTKQNYFNYFHYNTNLKSTVNRYIACLTYNERKLFY